MIDPIADAVLTFALIALGLGIVLAGTVLPARFRSRRRRIPRRIVTELSHGRAPGRAHDCRYCRPWRRDCPD